MAKVILDAGHGGNDPGAVYGERQEKNDTLRLALAVGEVLENNGLDVAYTRTTDVYHSPNEKVRFANTERGDLFVSIHRNSSETPNTYSGVESVIYNEGGVKEDAADYMNRNLEEVGFNDLGVDIRTNLAVLRGTKMPAVLLEIGFINSDEDNTLLDTSYDDVVNAIGRGIMEALDVNTEVPATYRYRVQVGLFRIYNNALNLQYQLVEEGYPAQIVNQGDMYAVHVGDFPNLDSAAALEKTLRRRGYNTLVVAV
ncbi:MAG: N-acetylmuramoyl-L-alanine amidase [Herbinix sp.]|jgi:N-acetylmuramoyl-L-alanine amidase|nr:N-acetylmuramoyl-L-alanine amidase [Herbinix sp.]